MKQPKGCKYFSQEYLLFNQLISKALQNLLFCNPKAAVLHGKSVGFVLQKSRFRNVKAQLSFFKRIIFTKSKKFSTIVLGKKKETNSFNKYRQPYFLSSSKT